MYYLVNLTTNPVTQQNRIQEIRNRLPDNARRFMAHQRVHWRRPLDGSKLLIEGDTDAAEDADMLARAWVQAGGTVDDARAYIAANNNEWNPPRGG